MPPSKRRPSQASGLRAKPSANQSRKAPKHPWDPGYKVIKKGAGKARDIGNALLPGNPFG